MDLKNELLPRRTVKKRSWKNKYGLWMILAFISICVYLSEIRGRKLSAQSGSIIENKPSHEDLLDRQSSVDDNAIRLYAAFNESNYLATSVIASSFHLLNGFDPSIETLWTCRHQESSQSDKKLVFVHVYKTAGSTFRMLFTTYAHTCGFGITVVTHCSELSAKSMINGSIWQNRDRSNCRHRTMNRQGRGVKKTSVRELQQHVDIAIGHLPLGVRWHGLSHLQPTDPTVDQYICFFRSPLEKYVSGVIYANKQYKSYPATVDATVKHIRTFVKKEVQHGKFRESYRSYLLTPWDKDRALPTVQSRTEQILRNLVQYSTIIGIVEKMDSSLELILHCIDKGHDVRSLFQQANTKNSNKTVTLNKSKAVDTKQVIAAIMTDAEFYSTLQSYLQFDAVIYEFALRLHDQQYRWLLQQRSVVSY